VVTNTSATQYTFVALQKNTTYLVNVVAFGSSGQSPAESDRIITTSTCYSSVLIDRTAFNTLSFFWNSFKPAVLSNGIQMTTTTPSLVSAIWSQNKICTNTLTLGFYARMVFTTLGSLDGVALVLQPVNTNSIGANGGSLGVENGNISTAFALEFSIYYGSVYIYTAKNGVTTSRSEPLRVSFPYSTTITAEIWYHPTLSVQSGRVSIPGTPATSFNYSLALSDTFSGYSDLYFGATASTGGAYNALTVHELFVGDYCTSTLCSSDKPNLQQCNSATGSYFCGAWGSCSGI